MVLLVVTVSPLKSGGLLTRPWPTRSNCSGWVGNRSGHWLTVVRPELPSSSRRINDSSLFYCCRSPRMKAERKPSLTGRHSGTWLATLGYSTTRSVGEDMPTGFLR